MSVRDWRQPMDVPSHRSCDDSIHSLPLSSATAKDCFKHGIATVHDLADPQLMRKLGPESLIDLVTSLIEVVTR